MHTAHLVSEYWPFARTGGLGEAVRGVSAYQASSGVDTSVFLPLYRTARERAGALEPATDDVEVPIHGRPRRCRILRQVDALEGPTVYFVDHPDAFDRPGIYGEDGGDYPDNHLRFGLFSRAVLEALPALVPAPPGARLVLHPHDWQTALTPLFLRTVYEGRPFYDAIACVLSVHNAGYQGMFGPETVEPLGLPASVWEWSRLEYYGKVNWLKGGLAEADWVTTVSPTHAHELRTAAGGFGLHDFFIAMGDRLVGILNGIDQELWNPADDDQIRATFDRDDLEGKKACKAHLQELAGLPREPEVPLVCMTARLARQKGFDLILDDGLLYRMEGAQFIFLGEGDPGYERRLAEISRDVPDRVAAFFDFTEDKEHRLLAGADILLMPSQYEPCGLTQMRAQRYGALPVVRRVGGLSDTVDDQETGFLFDEFSSPAPEVALRRAFALYPDREAWARHMRKAMARDFSWNRSAQRYLDLYAAALEAHPVAGTPETTPEVPDAPA